MKKIAIAFVGFLLLSGCVTNSYESVSDTVRKVSVENEGKVTFSHYELHDKKLKRWFEAVDMNGTWVLTEDGKAAKKKALQNMAAGC